MSDTAHNTDKIDKIAVDWQRRVSQALQILEPIERVRLPLKVRQHGGPFAGGVAYSPDSFKNFQTAIGGVRAMLKSVGKIL